MCDMGKGTNSLWVGRSLFLQLQCEIDLGAMVYLKSYSEVLGTAAARAPGNSRGIVAVGQVFFVESRKASVDC